MQARVVTRLARSADRWISRVALILAAAAIAATLLRGSPASPGPNLALLLGAFVALGVLVAAERRARHLTRKLVLGASACLLVLAVVTPPTQSTDVWAYAMYGRMVSHYQDSPYRHSAADYPDDPIAPRVARFWQGTRSVYGPLFTAVSAGGMAVAGRSALGARLFFQVLAALAVAASLLLVDRRTRDPVALAFLGVNPVTVVSVVNGGHNDALVGLAVLVAALLVLARRPAWAGAALAGAVLVKAVALVPAAAVAYWVWRRHGRRDAAVVCGSAAGIVVVGIVVAGGSAILDAIGAARTRFTAGSIWAGPRRSLISALVDSDTTRGAASGLAGRSLWWLSIAIAAGLTLVLCGRVSRRTTPASPAPWGRSGPGSPALTGRSGPGSPALTGRSGPFVPVGAAVLAYMLVGTHVLPWYVAWSLPALAICWRWPWAWVAVAQAGLLQLATIPGPDDGADPARLLLGTPVERFQLDLYAVWIPILEVMAVIAIVGFSVYRSRRPKGADSPVLCVADNPPGSQLRTEDSG